MHEPTALALSLVLALSIAAGGALGVLFFGGLWWTVRRGLASPTPAAWFFGSLVLRTGITACGFLLVSAGHWERAAACLLGFLFARVSVTRLTRGASENGGGPLRSAEHAP